MANVLGLETGGTVFLILVILAVVALFGILFLLASWGWGNENALEPPEPATAVRYIKHEHLILSVLWSGPLIKQWEGHFMNRKKRIAILVSTFLLNFIVVGIVFMITENNIHPVNCDLLQSCHDDACGGGEPITVSSSSSVATSYTELTSYELCPLAEEIVGFTQKDKSYYWYAPRDYEGFPYIASDDDFPDRCANAASMTENAERPCWKACVDDGDEEAAPVDTRLKCGTSEANALGLTVYDLICVHPSSHAEVCSEAVFTEASEGGKVSKYVEVVKEVNWVEVIMRILLTVIIVLPVSFLLKRFMKWVHFTKTTCCGRIKEFIIRILILVILAATALVAVLLIVVLKIDLAGALVISFLVSFLIGLGTDIPKLWLVYIIWKKKPYQKRYEYCRQVYSEKKAKAEKGGESSDLSLDDVAVHVRDAPVPEPKHDDKGKSSSDKRGKRGSKHGKAATKASSSSKDGKRASKKEGATATTKRSRHSKRSGEWSSVDDNESWDEDDDGEQPKKSRFGKGARASYKANKEKALAQKKAEKARLKDEAARAKKESRQSKKDGSRGASARAAPELDDHRERASKKKANKAKTSRKPIKKGNTARR